ncbi:hypothetical protein GCM10010430_28800 [Kitasatospora cystarginea]|uniref:Uncharacterized protein n=1 Tax=Kitasatospora cystarginea TaxID=58350 RepID=A0ABP5QZ41_9ACTN
MTEVLSTFYNRSRNPAPAAYFGRRTMTVSRALATTAAGLAFTTLALIAPSATPMAAAADSCRGSACDGKNPKAMGCGAGAQDIKGTAGVVVAGGGVGGAPFVHGVLPPPSSRDQPPADEGTGTPAPGRSRTVQP